MRILWIVNSLFPDLCAEMNIAAPNNGGWMYDLAKDVSASSGVELAIASSYGVSSLVEKKIKGITYFVLPGDGNGKKPEQLVPYWNTIIDRFNPDLIHIHGTEFPRALMCMRAFPDKRYIISMQGLTSVIERYFYANLSWIDIARNITIRDVLRRDSVFNAYKVAKQNGVAEHEYIKRAKHVIGRTTWDFAHAVAIHPSVKYHFCNESLRNEFYESPKWNRKNIRPYSLFLSQSERTLKGLHILLRAAAIVKSDFPEIRIRISGGDITRSDSWKEWLKMTGYGQYIKKLIAKLGLIENIEFVGRLNSSAMIEQYLTSHAFVCPSSIENSSNSLAEAQLLGVPSIASFVGGTPDMIHHGKDGLLYRFEEIEMLALFIKQVFGDDILSQHLSTSAIQTAEQRHNRIHNLNNLIGIYNEIVKD
jgi:glycosyltransferase involved in cell wall biosynthesis